MSLGVIQDQHRYCKHFQFWKQIQSWLSSPLKATCTAAYKLEATRSLFRWTRDMSRPREEKIDLEENQAYSILLSLNAVLTACTYRVKESVKGLKFLKLMNLTASYS